MVFKTVEEQAEYQAKLREKEKAAEQEALDEEMRKRRERVKAWQQAKASTTNGNTTNNERSQPIETETAAQLPVVDINVMSVASDSDAIPIDDTTVQQPKWSLEDEGDDDEEEEEEEEEGGGAEGGANHPTSSTSTQIPPPFNFLSPTSSGHEPPPLLAPLAPLVEHKQTDEEGDDDIESTVFINPKISLSSSGTHKPIKFSSSTTTTTPSKTIPTTNTTAPSEKPKPKLSDLSPIRTKSTTTPSNSNSNSNPVSTPFQSTISSSPLPAAAVEEEEEDPLDAFMKSLYSDPGLPQDPDARSVSSAYTYTETSSSTKPSSSSSNGGITGPASLSSRIRALDADPVVASSILRNSISTTNTTTTNNTNKNNKNGKSMKNKEVINPFGSNFITLEDIMRGTITTTSYTTSTATAAVTDENGNLAITTTQGGNGSGSSSGVRRKAGWESDVPSSPFIDSGHQGEEAEDEKEEIARREFMEALHKAATASTTSLTTSLPTSTLPTTTSTTTISKEQQQGDSELGRIFANDGDLIDDTTIITQKQKSALEILEESKKGKELKAVDHSLIQYIPIRKNLYIVPKILSKMSDQEIREKRENLHIKVRGKLCPIPVDSWEQCGLSDRILQVLDKLQLKEPFAIQKQAIPAIMCGRDVIAIAKTGSGRCIL